MTTRMRRPAAVMTVLLLSSTAGLRGAQPETAGDTVVVAAGAVRVSRAELLDVVREERTSGDLLRLAAASTPEGIETLSRRLLEQKLMAARARAASLDRDPATARAIGRVTDRLLADALVNEELARTDFSEAAMRRFYATHTGLFRSSPRRKARHIVVGSRDEAVSVADQLGRGADFGDIARQRNIDNTRANGGDLGWVAPGVMVKPFDTALFALSAGAVSDPVQTSFGWHIMRVDEIDPGALPPFELIADRVADAARSDVADRVRASVLTGVTVTVDHAALREIVR